MIQSKPDWLYAGRRFKSSLGEEVHLSLAVFWRACQLARMEEDAQIATQTATCACGAVSVHSKGKPLSMFLCACRDCQKASGTGHSALMLVRADHLSVTGETRGFALTAASGNRVTRHFCPVCGTPIFGETHAHPAVRLVPAGLFVETPWYAPRSVIFHRSHNDWDVLPDIPHYQTYREK